MTSYIAISVLWNLSCHFSFLGLFSPNLKNSCGINHCLLLDTVQKQSSGSEALYEISSRIRPFADTEHDNGQTFASSYTNARFIFFLLFGNKRKSRVMDVTSDDSDVKTDDIARCLDAYISHANGLIGLHMPSFI